jgi:uncharacterized repeat protein (TIGR03837 family)
MTKQLNLPKGVSVQRWVIFCKVIDNWGDIGVSWRLARQLAHEYPCAVDLWLDDLAALSFIWPDAAPSALAQTIEGVTIHHWQQDTQWHAQPAPSVLIEAFSCDAPSAYIAHARLQNPQFKWLSLDYLSAQPWIEGVHLLNSPQPNGLNKVFFFPGFTHKTGGLLREKTSSTADIQFYSDQEHGLKISLFGYDDMPLLKWLPLLNTHQTPVQLNVTSGKAQRAVQQACLQLGLQAGQNQSLHIQYLPMLKQTSFDALLQQSDLNFVRGEDSLVRAIWAEKPLTWHIYPQDDGAHWDKLRAFSSTWTQTFPAQLQNVYLNWQLAWNGAQTVHFETAWLDFVNQSKNLTHASAAAAQILREQPDLTAQLWKWAI